MKKVIASTVLAALLSPLANGAVVSFGDRVAFEAATTSIETATFEGIATPGSVLSTFFLDGYTDPLGFEAANQQIEFFTNPHPWVGSGFDMNWNSGDSMSWNADGDVLTITFDQAVTAVGFDFMGTYSPVGANLTFSSSVGTFTGTTIAQPARAFLGVVSDTAFNSFTLSADYPLMVMDNLSFQTAPVTVDVPEPATLGILMAGLGMLGIAGRARKSGSIAA